MPKYMRLHLKRHMFMVKVQFNPYSRQPAGDVVDVKSLRSRP